MNDLIAMIASRVMPDVFNPWLHVDPLDRDHDAAAVYRRSRLIQHFSCEPRFLLIGEAPGYQGCHFSGVPFTNEALILKDYIPRVRSNGRISRRERPWSEPSATIVWGTLHDLGIADCIVMWNAFAWHPHDPGVLLSNRTPTRTEVRAGLDVLQQVIRFFSPAPVVSVGAIAYKALLKLNVEPYRAVRHPAMGGAPKFREQMRELAAA